MNPTPGPVQDTRNARKQVAADGAGVMGRDTLITGLGACNPC